MGKVDLCKGILKSTKKHRGSHAFFRDNLALNLNKNADISIFLKKEGKDISLEFALTYRKANTF